MDSILSPFLVFWGEIDWTAAGTYLTSIVSLVAFLTHLAPIIGEPKFIKNSPVLHWAYNLLIGNYGLAVNIPASVLDQQKAIASASALYKSPSGQNQPSGPLTFTQQGLTDQDVKTITGIVPDMLSRILKELQALKTPVDLPATLSVGKSIQPTDFMSAIVSSGFPVALTANVEAWLRDTLGAFEKKLIQDNVPHTPEEIAAELNKFKIEIATILANKGMLNVLTLITHPGETLTTQIGATVKFNEKPPIQQDGQREGTITITGGQPNAASAAASSAAIVVGNGSVALSSAGNVNITGTLSDRNLPVPKEGGQQ